MRALQYAEYGPPEVLRVVDVEEPHAGTGQIRIAVKAAGVNPVDWKLRQGLMKRSLPAIPGSDVAGVVDEVGADVAGVSAGAAVFGFAVSGAAAQFRHSTTLRLSSQIEMSNSFARPQLSAGRSPAGGDGERCSRREARIAVNSSGINAARARED